MSTRLHYRLDCLRQTVDNPTDYFDREGPSAHTHAHPSGNSKYEAPSKAFSKTPVPPPMHIVLQGMLVNGRATSCDLIIPHVRRSAPAGGLVQHLDVVSCWKGVTHLQAWELATWDCFFKECLAMQIKEHLGHEFSRSLHGISPPKTLRCMVDRMSYFFERTHSMWINVDMLRLVDDMIGRMYTTYRSDTAQRRFPWTLSSGDLPSLVYNFVHAQDCLSYSIDGPSVYAGFSSRYSQGDMIVYVDLHGHYERTSFMGLRDHLSCGKSYRITPFTEVAGGGGDDHCNFSRACSEVTYSISKSPLPFQWDDDQECFHSLVYRGIQDHNGEIMTEVSAKISTPFHDGVRFERVSRYVLKLKVDQESQTRPVDSPYDAAPVGLPHGFGSPWIPSYTNTPLSKFGLGKPEQTSDDRTYMQDSGLRQMNTGYQPSTFTSERLEPRGLDATPPEWEAATSNDASLLSSVQLPHRGRSEAQHLSTSHVGQDGSSRTYPTPESLPSARQTSPGKRKAFQTETSTTELKGSFALDKIQHPDLSAEPKRRKVAQLEDPDVLMDDSAVDTWLDDITEEDMFNHLAQISTGLMGKAQPATSVWYKKDLTNRPGLPIKTGSSSSSKPHVASSGGKKQTTFVWPNSYHGLPSVAARVDEVMDDSTDAISPTASTSSHLLSQEQIQRNYQEFAKRQQEKAAEKAYYTATIPGFDGVVSPVDTEGKTFESIFLDDAKDTDAGEWESATETMSEGMSGIALKED